MANNATQTLSNGRCAYDPTFTDTVIAATGPKASARLKEIMPALLRHLHDFAREVHLTTDEYLAAVDMMNWAGKMSTDRRNEGQLLTDVLGLESLVDEITYKQAAAAASSATPSAILGPFWRKDAPIRKNGETIVIQRPTDGSVAYMYGKVRDAETRLPIAGAQVDIWQASTNGLYEQQDPTQPDHNLRGIYITDSQANYAFRCLRPTPYPIPSDGPAGKLLDLLDRHHYRPGHIHLIVTAPGYKSITTQVFDKETPYLNDDSVFAVKEGLAVTFVPRSGDTDAEWELEYDITMAAL